MNGNLAEFGSVIKLKLTRNRFWEDKNLRYLTSCGQVVVELLYAGKPQSCVPLFHLLPGSAVSIPVHRHTLVYAFLY